MEQSPPFTMNGLQMESITWGVGKSVSILVHSGLFPACWFPQYPTTSKSWRMFKAPKEKEEMPWKHLGEHSPCYRSIILGSAASFTNICIKLTETPNQNLDFKGLAVLLSFSEPVTQLLCLKSLRYISLLNFKKNEKNGTNGKGREKRTEDDCTLK